MSQRRLIVGVAVLIVALVVFNFVRNANAPPEVTDPTVISAITSETSCARLKELFAEYDAKTVYQTTVAAQMRLIGC